MVVKSNEVFNIPVVAGIQPTGNLHLGHYASVIRPMLNVEGENARLFIADLHARTSTPFSQIWDITKSMHNALMEFGFEEVLIQSTFATEILQVAFSLQCVCPNSLAQRSVAIKGQDAPTVGHLVYPILQAADIAVFGSYREFMFGAYHNRAFDGTVYGTYDTAYVMVGPDQLPHLELANDLYRRTNIGFDKALPMIQTVSVRGSDGQKMSKSKHNEIPLRDRTLAHKRIKMTVTNSTPLSDPKSTDQPLFDYLMAMNPEDKAEHTGMFESGASYGAIKSYVIERYDTLFSDLHT